ncbi:MAG: CDP-alcohol phosphatidyltransferase family protein [Nitrospira sp.]|nr:CDP-alcohol phosphatidyltransferase family protein [Nitrospira sp.]
MPSVYALKPAFQRLLRPLVQWLFDHGVTANQVTVAAFFLSTVTGLAIAVQPTSLPLLGVIPPVLFLRMALNAVDGMLAREHHMGSRLGAILNELGDVLADAALYLPLALVPGLPALLIVLFVLFGVIAEMTGVVAVQIGAARNYAGPMGKSDRAVLVGVIALLLAVGVPAGFWCTVLFGLGVALSLATIVNRAKQALREAS